MRWLQVIDPRRSLAAGAMWLIIGLSVAFSVAAALWVGRIARQNVVEQHVRRLSLETEQFGSEFSQALAARLDAVRAAGAILQATSGAGAPDLGAMYAELTAAYPQLGWIGIADRGGTVVAAADQAGELRGGGSVLHSPWFVAGLRAPWVGLLDGDGTPGTGGEEGLGDLAAPVRDNAGRVVGVVAAHLRWPRVAGHPERLTDETDPRLIAQACVLDDAGVVLIGPPALRDRRWPGIVAAPAEAEDPGTGAPGTGAHGTGTHGTGASGTADATAPHFERLPGDRLVLVARSPVSAAPGFAPGFAPLGWQVQLSEPNARVYRRADALTARILAVSLGLGAATALLGTLIARQLTARLRRLTHSVAAVGRDAAQSITVPAGVDEAAQLGSAFARILDDLQRDRGALQALSSELERRVEVRTREVERLAEESRYAAIVRERLKIARDLHDTLAHSLMALLSEIRFLRRLHAHDPAALPAELLRAEEIAHEGLNEARTAITQMRLNAVRDTGLGPALSRIFDRFLDHTGLAGEFAAEPEAARFGDERAETMVNMAQEILRNVERHARATRVSLHLRTLDAGRQIELAIEDDGIGFDPTMPRPGHFGLVGLREQAELAGAVLRIESAPDRGTRVSIAMPLSPITFAAGAATDHA